MSFAVVKFLGYAQRIIKEFLSGESVIRQDDASMQNANLFRTLMFGVRPENRFRWYVVIAPQRE